MTSWVKRLTAMALAGALLFTAGCSPAAKEGTSAASGDGPVEIEFWYGLGSVAGETMEGIIADFNASQDKVKVTGVQQPSYSDTFQKVQAALASKQAPAVFISDNMQELAQRDIIAPLDDVIDDRTPKDDYLEVFMDPAVKDGQIMALPAYGTTQVCYYRKDLLSQAGVDPKDMYSSWEKVYESSKQLQDQGVAQYGHLFMWDEENLMDLALSAGGKILSDDGKQVLINSPEWVESWDFVRKQIFDDKTMKIESGGQGWEYWYRTIDNVLNGVAIGYTGSSGDKGDLDFNIIDSCEQPGFNGHEPKPRAGSLYMVVPKIASDEQKKAAYEWMAYFNSPEVCAKWSQKIGYIPVRKAALEVEEYKKFLEENPYAAVPYNQAQHASPAFFDPTGSKIIDALKKAADKLELENVPAKEALDAAQKEAQTALDEVNSK